MDPRHASRRQFMTPTPVLDRLPTAPLYAVRPVPSTVLQHHLAELRDELAAHRAVAAELVAGLGLLAARVDAALAAAEAGA